MNLKNTHIEELVLVDEAALEVFYDSIENTEFYVENLSFGSRLNTQNEKFLKLIKRVHEGETAAPKKIKTLALNRNSFFDFLEEARSIPKRKIHVEDLVVTQTGKDTGPETNTKIVVSKKIGIVGNICVLLFIELGPELSHLNIDEIQRQCRSPWIDIPRISIRLTENKIIMKENPYGVQFLKKNIAAAEVSFFAKNKANISNGTRMTLAVGKMESIVFGGKGFSVLSSITNEKIDARHMAVMDIVSFFDQKRRSKEERIRDKREAVHEKHGNLFLGAS
ncbi:MAG: uncharacterized protein A8A55_2784 [Amphiamblys sp. WSBS2006]|nr:MAG: uncharacterized protein A8A55_2784 [Amphiamblys sp. WSBS2006]